MAKSVFARKSKKVTENISIFTKRVTHKDMAYGGFCLQSGGRKP